MDAKDFVEVGKVVKTHGISGELIVELDNPEILEETTEPVILEIEGLRVPFFISHAQVVSAQRVRVQFDCTNTEKRAKSFVGCPVFVSPELLDNRDDSLMSPNAITDFMVVDKAKGELGKVKRVDNLNINPLMVVGDNEILIPFHPDFVLKIDFRKRKVQVTVPENLIHIND